MAHKYQKNLKDILDSSRVAFTLSLAKDVGLIDVLITSDQPLTTTEVAQKGRLKERYVREIMGTLCGSEIVCVSTNDGGENVYHVTDAGKQVLGTMQPYFAMTNVLIEAYKPARSCVPLDGPSGVSYGDELFKALDDIASRTGDELIGVILNSVPELHGKLESGISVMEFGCGSGRLLSKFAQKFPNSTFTASEYRQVLVDKLQAAWGHVPNMCFRLDNICSVPETGNEKYDLIYCTDVIHDLPHPGDAFRGVRRLLREPDGIFIVVDKGGTGSHSQDVGSLDAASWYTFGTFLCIPESFQQEDSEAHGPNWHASTAIRIAESAGLKVKLHETNLYHENFFICRPA